MTPTGTANLFLSKMNANGSFAWAKQISGTTGLLQSTEIITDDSGNVYMCGTFQSGNCDLDPGPSTHIVTAIPNTFVGFVLKLDSAGNAKASDALKNRADRSANPNKPATGAVSAKVTGNKDGDDTIKVESIDVQ